MVTQYPFSNNWAITQVGVVTNERVAGILPINVRPIGSYFTHALFQLQIIVLTDLTLDSVRLYGSGAATNFPAPGAVAESIVEWSGAGVPAAGQGVLRVPSMISRAGGLYFPLSIIPQFLMIEYTTSAPLGAPSLTAVVGFTLIGELPDGVQ